VRADRKIGRAAVLAVVLMSLLALPWPASAASADGGQDFDAAFVTPPATAEREAQLVQGEDERLIDVRVAGAARQITYPLRPYRVRSSGLYTLVLPARRAAYTIDDLRELMPQTFLLQRDGTYLLREHILVDTGATLALAPSKPMTIRMSSGAGGFVSIVARGGKLRLLGSASAPLTFTSWDETNTEMDTDVTDGRAYILAMGQLIVKHANFQDLGFWSGRTGGLALASSGNPTAGLDLGSEEIKTETGSSTDSRQAEVLPAGALPAGDNNIDAISGQVSDTTIKGNAFGFFVTGASGINLKNMTISDSLVDGLILHRSVTSAQVDQVLVQGSGADGIVITRGVEGALISQVTSTGNGRDGIVITGTPLATGPSPSGSSIRQFGNNVVTASLVQGNARTGVRIVGGTKVRLLGNSIQGGLQGILVSTGADGVVIDANRVANIDGSGIQVRDAKHVELSGNSVRRAHTGVHGSNSQIAIEDNTVAGATLHAVTLVGDVTGTTVTGNVLAGQGSSAIDLARLDGGSEPKVSNNDAGGWDRTITKDGVLSTIKHPLTVIWMVVLVLIIVGRALLYRRRAGGVRTPYLDGAAKSASVAAIEQDQEEALRRLHNPEQHNDPEPRPQSRYRQPEPMQASQHPDYVGARPADPAAGSDGDPHRPPSAEDNAAWLRQVRAP
jgi:hypothetical protein